MLQPFLALVKHVLDNVVTCTLYFRSRVANAQLRINQALFLQSFLIPLGSVLFNDVTPPGEISFFSYVLCLFSMWRVYADKCPLLALACRALQLQRSFRLDTVFLDVLALLTPSAIHVFIAK